MPTAKQATIELMMPIWTPGYYRVENYASRVSNFTAQTADGKELKFEQPTKNRWKVETGGADKVVLNYQLACTNRSVTGNWVGKDLLVLNGGPSFMTLVEKTKRPHEVRLELPEAWKSSISGLDAAASGKANHYVAADYDTLVDSPIMAGNLSVNEFEVGKSKHFVVAGGETAQWDGKRAAADFKVRRGKRTAVGPAALQEVCVSVFGARKRLWRRRTGTRQFRSHVLQRKQHARRETESWLAHVRQP